MAGKEKEVRGAFKGDKCAIDQLDQMRAHRRLQIITSHDHLIDAHPLAGYHAGTSVKLSSERPRHHTYAAIR
jgi:hypothetical protein